MIKIYFDEELINSESYTSLSNVHELLLTNFALGSTASNTYELKVYKDAVVSIPEIVDIYEDETQIAHLDVDSYAVEDEIVSLKLTDLFVRMNTSYNAKEIIEASEHQEEDGTKYVTLLELVQNICRKFDVTLGTTNFYGYDKHISWYDNTLYARDYIGFVAELNGGYAYLENDTLLFKEHNKESVETISKADCSNFVLGEYHKISRVVYDNGIEKWESGDTTNDTLYIDKNNKFITSQADITAIGNKIIGFEFYNIDPKNCPVNSTIKAGDVITFVGDYEQNYKTIANVNKAYFGSWTGKYYLSINTLKEEETQIKSEADQIKDVRTEIDRANARITTIAQEKVGKDEIIAKLNVAVEDGKGVINLVGNSVTIDSDNFTLDADGKIDATAGEIGGFNLSDVQFKSNVSGLYEYTMEDLHSLKTNIMSDGVGSEPIKYTLDFDNNNVTNAVDYAKILTYLNGHLENTAIKDGTFEINSNNPKNCLLIKDKAGNMSVSAGIGGINTCAISTTQAIISDADYSDGTTNFYGVAIDGGNPLLSIKGKESQSISLDGRDGNITASGNITCSKVNNYTLNKACEKDVYNSYVESSIPFSKIEDGTAVNTLPTLEFLANWNGAYGTTGSTLKYARQGEIQCKPTVLYNNTTGTTGNVALSDAITNYNYIKVYANKSGCYTSQTIALPTVGKSFCLSINNPYQSKTVQSIYGVYQLASKQITKTRECNQINNGGFSDANEIYIVRVEGWK